jgi:hypothetical protein
VSLRDDDLGPETTAAERESLTRVAAVLGTERPVPRAVFRGQLRRHLVTDRSSHRTAGPAVRRWGIACLVAGSILLGSAGIGLVGAGPLAPSDAEQIVTLLGSVG